MIQHIIEVYFFMCVMMVAELETTVCAASWTVMVVGYISL